ncbi:MAG: UDP-3-O-[3-hydroxymyristoyl] N-acetylglucosamine deacetylase [Pseudopedobacter saltans]|uniref:Multifunctional fusion protein n=1 Tax=Pseudopedobacter saltans TaxID=151895 RepID=A0A2W5F2X0_9SPHI|nr:MAG: UDP-3-O-[3-hydroxymyristoyl] N-acetylglucosamine deacetylase [Pseudopedobacter saltans]
MELNFNPNKQHTIGSNISLEGVGLHTGASIKLTISPANSNEGIVFKRIDLDGQPTVKADCEKVGETRHNTTLQQGEAKVSTIEHLLAALAANSIDNVLVSLDGPEVPILDGSSKLFVDAILQVGIVEQEADKIWYEIKEPISYYDEATGTSITAIPCDHFSLTSMIDFNSPVLGCQYATLEHIEDFNKEIADCRTFTFLHEIEPLLKNNLIKGGDLDNAIVIVDKPVSAETESHLRKLFSNKDNVAIPDKGYLNNGDLKYSNEPARHKLLDVVGDLSLVGFPFKAKIIANKPGHRSNVEFAKLVKQYIKKLKQSQGIPVYDSNATPVYNYADIENTLPHRYPFLLVDKIIELTDTHIVGVKNVTFNEPFFQGHFPGNPIMPGVLQIEALAQTGGVLCINAMNDGAKYDTYFLKIDNCKFKQMIRPGDTLLLKMELSAPIRRGICEMHGSVYVNDKLAAEADLVAQIVKRKQDS